MLDSIVKCIREFFSEMGKTPYLSGLMMFLYISVIFITFSVVSIYKSDADHEDRIINLERLQ